MDDKFDRFMDQYGELEEGVALVGEEIEGTIEEGRERRRCRGISRCKTVEMNLDMQGIKIC